MTMIIHLQTRKIVFRDDAKLIEIWRMSPMSRKSSSSFAGYWAMGKPRVIRYDTKAGARYLKRYR